jgi:transcriptional regulator with XRE-family HTH domain
MLNTCPVPERNQELADFLRRARSQVDPARSGLPSDGRIRRVPGLRREEVAQLARVSTDYYTRLEQGRAISPTPGVVAAIARALELDETGRAHLGHLIAGSGTAARPRRVQRPRQGLLQLMDSLDGVPAMLLGRRTDVLATNALARALIADFDAMPAKHRNYGRWMFLSPDARTVLVDWEAQARLVVDSLRFDAGRNPDDPATQALVGELTLTSADFAAWWQEHRVHRRTFGDKRFRHPLVGELTLQFETLALPGDDAQSLFLYSAPPGSKDRQGLDLLANWMLDGERRALTDLRP